MKKRALCVLMAMLLLCGVLPMTCVAQEIQVEVNGQNCVRDAGKLIVYTDAYGESTKTNAWGVEAVVDDTNRVIEIVNGNASIPAGGFVVSGHDDEEKEGGKRMKTWIRENIKVGDYVYFERRTSMLTVSDQPIAEKSPFFSFDNPADAVNTDRGENQMILYTAEYGTTTGTNEYGYEVVVEDGIVTKMGGNNSVIPANGFVVSLHGSPAKWMRIKIVTGMMVEVDSETLNVVFTYSAESLQKAVTYSLDQAQKGIDEAKKSFVYADYDTTQASLDALRSTYQTVLEAFRNGGKETAFADECDLIIEQASVLCNALCDSYPVQYRGVWIRPSQKTAKQVEAYVKELHEAGINFVCVEGWFENGVIMEVPEGSLFGRHPSFRYDVLQAYIDACHKYGMECHLWMPIMNIGSLVDDGFEERSVTGQKEEWLSLNNMGQPYNKDGFMMVDPANQEAKEYLLEFYRYLVTTYDIDCFEMDYIRYYPASGDADFGYTEAAYAGFEEAYGYGVTPKYNREADYWEDWCQYRRDCITQWVREIRAMIDREAPDVLLAADVAFPFSHALDSVYQDFPSWLEEGLLDILHPMAYGDGYGEDIQKAVELGGQTCMVVTGLGAHVDVLGAKELERQARENNLYGAFGECYFEASSYLADRVAQAAVQTVYRNDALPMFLDVNASMDAMLDYMNGRIEDVVLPLGGVSKAEADAVIKAIAAAKGLVENEARLEALKALQAAIAKLDNVQANQVLSRDLERIVRIVNTATGSSLVMEPAVDNKPWYTGSSWQVAIAVGIVAIAAVVIAAVVLFKPKKKEDDA